MEADDARGDEAEEHGHVAKLEKDVLRWRTLFETKNL